MIATPVVTACTTAVRLKRILRHEMEETEPFDFVHKFGISYGEAALRSCNIRRPLHANVCMPWRPCTTRHQEIIRPWSFQTASKIIKVATFLIDGDLSDATMKAWQKAAALLLVVQFVGGASAQGAIGRPLCQDHCCSTICC